MRTTKYQRLNKWIERLKKQAELDKMKQEDLAKVKHEEEKPDVD